MTTTSAPWVYPTFLAHRIGGTLAPENTVSGIDVCVKHGYRMVEFDVRLTANNVPFLMHDDTLERTTNGHGMSNEWQWIDLYNLDAGSWFGEQFAGEKLPALYQMGIVCQRHDILANIEMKSCPGNERRTATHVARALNMFWKDRWPLVSSFSQEMLAVFRECAPDFPVGMLFKDVPADWKDIVKRLDCSSVHVKHTFLNAEIVKEMHALGLKVMAYTVNDVDAAQALLSMGVDHICTDRPDLLRC